MSTYLIEFTENTWYLVAEMAPYLLFGFAVAGCLHILIRRELVERWLGKPGMNGVVKASVLGVPMPLCSCSVIPVAASLRKSGATRGATASFLSSTPQTGVDSIMATYALLGGVFTAVRVFVAFICGIVAGYLIERFCQNNTPDKTSTSPQLFTLAPAVTSPLTPPSPKKLATEDCCTSTTAAQRRPVEALRYGFVTLPADLGKALIFGLLLAGLITTLMPENLLSGALSAGPMAFLLATAISIPLYVCATASIPMAFAFMAAGLSPGATLVFLITGPATNTATIAAVWKMLGRRATAIYLFSLLVISWLAGWIFNATLDREPGVGSHMDHAALESGLWQHASGILLLGLLMSAIWINRRPKVKTCCAG
jgi:uncharacterized membrane protein YraQ (UPF0718 family)